MTAAGPEELHRAIAAAYDVTGGSWERGAGRVYNHLADVVVDLSPVSVDGRLVLDVGAGTGAASRAIARRGGRVIAVDAARGVLADRRRDRPPAAIADALALPLQSRVVGGFVAAFSLNHAARPEVALVEARRVCRPGSPIVVATYAEDDGHPAKAAVLAALHAHGWEPPAWYGALQKHIAPLLSSVESARAVCASAGLRADVLLRRVPMPWLGPGDLVDWRLGMAQHAPFVDQLPAPDRAALRAAARRELGSDPPPLERSILVIAAVA